MTLHDNDDIVHTVNCWGKIDTLSIERSHKQNPRKVSFDWLLNAVKLCWGDADAGVNRVILMLMLG